MHSHRNCASMRPCRISETKHPEITSKRETRFLGTYRIGEVISGRDKNDGSTTALPAA